MAITEMNPIFFRFDKFMLNYVIWTLVQKHTCNHVEFIITAIAQQEQIHWICLYIKHYIIW